MLLSAPASNGRYYLLPMLSGWTDSRSAPEATAAPLEGTPPGIVEAMDAPTFFTRLAQLMVDNPPAAADAPALERLEAIGLAPGSFDPPAGAADAIQAGASAAMAKLKHPTPDAGPGQPLDGANSYRLHFEPGQTPPANASGSQHESPGAEREPNWLPARSGSFNLILRIYWPKQEAIDGNWAPPGIKRA